jgi:nucleotide-binding universal stress UspA family protein
MPQSPDIFPPIIDNVLHPSDFTEASRVAFAHALKAALVARARLTLLHVSKNGGHEWMDFPGVRETLERWNLLPKGSLKSAVPQLGIDVHKVIEHDDDPAKSVLSYLERHGADLVVLASHHRDGRAGWLHRSVSEPVARKSGQMTLFLPAEVRGFVSLEDGSVSLKNILVPIAAQPRPQPALAALAVLVQQLQCGAGAFTLLHVGREGSMPAVSPPEVPGWQWRKQTREGDVVEAILDAARESKADLIVMTTDGRHGFLDALRGSHSERVLRHAPCPLLAIPEASQVAGALD